MFRYFVLQVINYDLLTYKKDTETVALCFGIHFIHEKMLQFKYFQVSPSWTCTHVRSLNATCTFHSTGAFFTGYVILML